MINRPNVRQCSKWRKFSNGWQYALGRGLDDGAPWLLSRDPNGEIHGLNGNDGQIRVTSDRAPRVGDRVETPDGEGVVDKIGDLEAYSVWFDGPKWGAYRADELTVIWVPAAESPPEPQVGDQVQIAADVSADVPHHITFRRNLEGVGNAAIRISSPCRFTIDDKPGWQCGCGQHFDAELAMFPEDLGEQRDLAPGDIVELPSGGRGVVIDAEQHGDNARVGVEVLPFDRLPRVDGYATAYQADELRRVL